MLHSSQRAPARQKRFVPNSSRDVAESKSSTIIELATSSVVSNDDEGWCAYCEPCLRAIPIKYPRRPSAGARDKLPFALANVPCAPLSPYRRDYPSRLPRSAPRPRRTGCEHHPASPCRPDLQRYRAEVPQWRGPRCRRTLEPSLRRPADGPRKGCWFLYGPVPREHGLRTEVRDQSGRSAQLPWSMARLPIPSRLSVISRSHAVGRRRPYSAFCFQKYRRRSRRRVRASIRFSKRAPSSDSPPARPIPPKYVRRLHISHLRALVPVSSPPP